MRDALHSIRLHGARLAATAAWLACSRRSPPERQHVALGRGRVCLQRVCGHGRLRRLRRAVVGLDLCTRPAAPRLGQQHAGACTRPFCVCTPHPLKRHTAACVMEARHQLRGVLPAKSHSDATISRNKLAQMNVNDRVRAQPRSGQRLEGLMSFQCNLP